MTQGTRISARNLQALAWVAFGLAAPQILFLRDWESISISNYDGNSASMALAGIGQAMNGLVVLFAFLASLKLFFKNGRTYAFISAGSWIAGLSAFLLSDFLLMQQEKLNGLGTEWYNPLESIKYISGLVPTSPTWWQWVNLGGTVSAIIWLFVAIKIGKPDVEETVGVSQDPTSWQNETFQQNSFVDQIQQSQTIKVFCSQCGAKSLGSSTVFCSNCGSRI